MAKRTYTNGEINVLWDSDLCTHCEACWRGLPQVFDPKARPWVNVLGATSKEIVEQVAKCPSGALKTENGKCFQ
jgi:putative redox protein